MKIKLNKKMIEQVGQLAEQGLHFKAIYPALGIGSSTFDSYRKRGRELHEDPDTDVRTLSNDDKLKLEFHKAVIGGRAKYIQKQHVVIAETQTAKDALEMLARLEPRLYGRKQSFDEEQIYKWFQTHFSEDAVERILQIMEEDN